MNSFVMLIEPEGSIGYDKYIRESAREDKVFYISRINGVFNKLWKIHFSGRLNQKKELPFKRVWFKRMLKGIDVDCSDMTYFIFFEEWLPSYSSMFLKYLTKKYPNSKKCLVLTNPIESEYYRKLLSVKDQYDMIVTFLKDDADKYGMEYYQYGFAFAIPNALEKTEITSDVLFVGNAKGRHERILNIYENLKQKGYLCDFNIVGVAPQDQKYAGEITYNNRISYDEVIKKVKRTRCILEVVYNNYNYCSLRTLEAALCHKKLITTNRRITELPIYSREYISIIDEDNDVDSAFIDKDIDLSVYPDKDFCSFSSFRDFITSSEKE